MAPLRARDQEGSSLIELTVTLPILITIFLGAADLGRVYYHAQELTAAARTGAQLGAVSTSKTSTDMTNAAVAASPDLALSSTNVTVAEQRCHCTNDDGSGFGTPTAGACSATCSSSQHKIYYAVVTVSKSFNLLSNYLPGVPTSITVTRTAWQRIK